MTLLDSARHVLDHGFACINEAGEIVPTPDWVFEDSEYAEDSNVVFIPPDDIVLLDHVTANLIVKVCEGLNDENRAKLLAMDPLKAVDICWKLVK